MRDLLDIVEAYSHQQWRRWWANMETGEILEVPTPLDHDAYFLDHLDTFLGPAVVSSIVGDDDLEPHLDPLLIAAYQAGWIAIIYDDNNGAISFRSSEYFVSTPLLAARILRRIAREVPFTRIDIDVYMNGEIHPFDLTDERAIQLFLRWGRIT